MTKPSDFWYTPPYVLDAVKSFFGFAGYGDPCPINPEFNGLQNQWLPELFINPPYSNPLRRQFIDKAMQEYNGGRFLWLLNFGNNQDSWELQKCASAICIPEKRIKFIPGHPDLGDGKSPRYDSIFILWGDPSGFEKAFKDIGKVYISNPQVPSSEIQHHPSRADKS